MRGSRVRILVVVIAARLQQMFLREPKGFKFCTFDMDLVKNLLSAPHTHKLVTQMPSLEKKNKAKKAKHDAKVGK